MVDLNGWTIVKKLGEGGQGEVSLVVGPERSGQKSQAIHRILAALQEAGAIGKSPDEKIGLAQNLAYSVSTYSRDDRPDELGALKQYKIPAGESGAKPRARFQLEVEALQKINHPNLLRFIDANTAANWIITRYYPGGVLTDHADLYRGKPLKALLAFRGLVDGVARLHAEGTVHRDIKPPNIFVDRDELILGDFGIVFHEGAGRRVTESLERVGTRDWMAPWAHTGRRVDEVKPSFDVFGLGKVLWSMVSGESMLPYWYYAREPYNLIALFPKDEGMQVINEILSRCVVEEEDQCLPSALELLERVDQAIDTLRRDRQTVGDAMRCLVCAAGVYRLMYGGSNADPLRLLLVPQRPGPSHRLMEHQLVQDANGLTVRVYRCDRCGNLQLFNFPDGAQLPAWARK